MKNLVRLMLDSGVFSAWNRKETLDLKTYIKFVKVNLPRLWTYVNMDKIPGEFGKERTQKEVDDSAKEGYDNCQRMKDAGLAPIPVFHQGENWDWLARMIADGEKYIGISTAKDLPLQAHVDWLDQVFTAITDTKGHPIVKTHGFGITRPNLVFAYPWFSCDSTTWTLSPGFGQILVPPYKNGAPDYTQLPMQVVLSHKERTTSSGANRFEYLGKEIQAQVIDYIGRSGVTLEYAIYNPDSRRKVMLIYYTELQKAHIIKPFSRHAGNIFRIPPLQLPKGQKRESWDQVNVMLATNLNRAWSKIMNDCGAHSRLISYYELMDKGPECLEEYVTTGVIAGHKLKTPRQEGWGEHYSTFRRLKLLQRKELYDGTEDLA